MKFRFAVRTSLSMYALGALTLAAAVAIVSAAGQNTADSPAGTKPPPAVLDPTTGLPGSPQWKDPAWKDPEKILPDVSYDGLPISEVARHLQSEFKNAFDVLVPDGWRDPNNPATTPSLDVQSFSIKLRLKNVTASEIFNGMNLLFESENSPLRWDLTMNGRRPTAVLHVLPALVPPVIPEPPEAKSKRMIYFVGDLLGDPNSEGIAMEEVVKTVSEVYQMSYGAPTKPDQIQFHKEAQLLIVNGTREQIETVQLTLSALRQKAQRNRPRGYPEKPQPDPSESKPKNVAPKAP